MAAYVQVLKVARCLYTVDCQNAASKIIFVKRTYAEVNVSSLNRFEDGATVDPAALVEAGILKNVCDGVRVLGNGEITKKLTVVANGFTKSAEEKITAAGGKVEVI